jgi:hypothetical protein
MIINLVLQTSEVTIQQFNLLTEDSQANTIYEEGVLISLRTTSEYRILLYQVEGFYVEVYYHPRHNEIKEFKSFTSTEELEPYLEKINLEGVF